jgi:chromosome segregation ATPase
LIFFFFFFSLDYFLGFYSISCWTPYLKMAGSGDQLPTGEELRRKHIMTLEVCQRLSDENDMLRKSQKTDVLQELARLKEKAVELAQCNSALERRIADLEQLNFGLSAELESERIVHKQNLGKVRSDSEEVAAKLKRIEAERRADTAATTEKQQELELEADSLRAAAAAAAAERDALRHDNDTLREDVAAAEDAAARERSARAQAQQGREAGAEDSAATAAAALAESQARLAAAEEAIATLKGALHAEKARAGKADEDHARSTRELNGRAEKAEATLKTSDAEGSRLRAENGALQAEVQRLSQQIVMPPNEPESNDGSGSRLLTPRSQKKHFADFIALKRENQLLRQQIEAIKATQTKTVDLSKRIGGGLGASKRGQGRT